MAFRLTLEKYGPAAVAAACAFVWWYQNCTVPGAYSKELLGALLSAAAISAGFLTTALSVLLPMGGTETGRKLTASGRMSTLHRYLRSAIVGCLALSAVCIALFFFLPEETPTISSGLSAVLVCGTVYTALAMGRTAEILLNLFERMSNPEDKDG